MGLFDFVANAMTEDKVLPGSDSTDLSLTNTGAEGLNNVLQSLAKASANQGGDNSTYGRMSPLGLDAVIQDWVRQQFIYRRSILQDLFIMAFQVTEIRSAILSIKREVFRKGLSEWQPKFARKCVECGKEYDDEDTESCTEEDCYKYEVTPEERYDPESGNRVPMRVRKYVQNKEGKRVKSDTVPPDPAQQEYFNRFIGDGNTFHQPILDVFNEFMTDVLIADDGFLLLNKEYIIDNETGEISQSRVFEITRLHPALVEYDIDRKDGLPERSHWLCPIHRNQQVMTGPGFCNVFADDGGVCGGKLAPALFRYYWRGRDRKRAQRLKMIAELGGCCVICGFSDWRALQFDHILGGGTQHKKSLNNNANRLHNYILVHRDEFQLLCANCNWIKKYDRDETALHQTRRV